MKILKIQFILTFLLSVCLFSPSALAQETTLTVETIMQNPDHWIGSLPSNEFWSDDSKTIYFDWNPEKKLIEDLYQTDLNGSNPTKVSVSVLKNMIPQWGVVYNVDKTKRIYTSNGDLILENIKNKSSFPILEDIGRISGLTFLLDGNIGFSMEDNYFVWNAKNGQLKKVTNIKIGESSPPPPQKDELKDFLKTQQYDLFQVLNDKKAKDKAQRKQGMLLREKGKKPIKIKKGLFLNGLAINPNGKYISYSTIKRNGAAPRTEVAHFITEDGYVSTEKARNKVGYSSFISNDMYIYNIAKDTVCKIETNDIPGIREYPEYYKEYNRETPEEDRKVGVYGPYWSNNGEYAVVEVRSDDHKDRWIMLLNPETGKLELLDRQRDEAWIGGPGVSNYWRGTIGWLADNKTIYFQSEETGYSHLYTLNVSTKTKKALTKGKFEVYNPEVSKDGKYWYFSSNEVHYGERHFYKMPIAGGQAVQLTNMEGSNMVTLSPDEKWLLISHSFANKPWELYLQKNKANAEVKKLTNSLTEEFQAYKWKEPEFVTFKAEDGADVPARLYKPSAEKNNGAAVIFVHGAGYLQNAHKWWSSYFREYMFHNLLVDLGYTVLDMDYRGSAGLGRDWRTSIYRHMGGKDLSDQVDGAKWLVKDHGVNASKIGIYGGSYGGFITLMAMFNESETFAAGAGLRSVTDWAHYNHGYTSNILNTPTLDSIAYRRSSPIYFADGLEGDLLMCHGMVDDNVQFQDIVRLSQRLIELGKDNWELAVFPFEPHGFKEPSSWTDEYKRILKLFEESLK